MTNDDDGGDDGGCLHHDSPFVHTFPDDNPVR